MIAKTTTVPTYVYVTYIRARAEQVWRALTDADVTAATGGTSTSLTGSRVHGGSIGGSMGQVGSISSVGCSKPSHRPVWSSRSGSPRISRMVGQVLDTLLHRADLADIAVQAEHCDDAHGASWRTGCSCVGGRTDWFPTLLDKVARVGDRQPART